MRRLGLGIVSLATLGLLAACGSTDTMRASTGGAAGALGGAVVGGPVGALVGGAGGAAAGASMDESITEDLDLGLNGSGDRAVQDDIVE